MKSKQDLNQFEKSQLKNSKPENYILSGNGLIIGHKRPRRHFNIIVKDEGNIKKKENENLSYKRNLLEFFKQTSCHGLPFIGNRNISYFERFFFIGVVTTVLFVACTFIFEVYQTWSLTPIIIQKENNPTKTTTFPFPAITICNKNQALKSKVKNMKVDTVQYGILQMMCNRYDEIDFDKIQHRNSPENFDNFKLFNDTITKLAQPCQDLIIQCTYGGEDFNCDEIFQPTMTDEGLCCTFNALHPKFMFTSLRKHQHSYSHSDAVPINWNARVGYPDILPKKFYPQTILGAGIQKGLTITLDIQLDEYYCSSTDGAGIKFNVHSPVETSLIKEIGYTVGSSQDLRILLTPQYTIATPDIAKTPIEARQCLYVHESNLSYYRIYTMKNGQNECMSLKFFQVCGCVPFYMPRVPSNVRYCNLAEFACIYNYLQDPEYDNEQIECYEFLPACFNINYLSRVYTAEIYHGLYDSKSSAKLEAMSQEYITKNIISMNFFFEEEYYYSLVRRKFVDTTTSLSYTGGLVSLFMGMSSITFVEIFYFMFLRHLFAKFRFNKKIKMMKNIE